MYYTCILSLQNCNLRVFCLFYGPPPFSIFLFWLPMLSPQQASERSWKFLCLEWIVSPFGVFGTFRSSWISKTSCTSGFYLIYIIGFMKFDMNSHWNYLYAILQPLDWMDWKDGWMDGLDSGLDTTKTTLITKLASQLENIYLNKSTTFLQI